MSNIVKFKINGLSSALSNVYTRVTDLSRVELFEGETLVSDASGNVELDIGLAGSVGQGVIVYGDNYATGNEATFKSFSGYSTVEVSGVTPSYTNVVVVGASIIERSFGRDLTTPNAAATQAFKDAGVDVNVYGYGFSGTVVSQIATRLQEAMVAFPNGDTLFIAHAGGNDVSSNRPFSGLTQPQKDAIDANFQLLFDVVNTKLDDCMVSSISFRPYANITDDTIFNDESLGSKPFNDEFVIPKINAQFINTDGMPVVDIYDFTRNDFKRLLSADGVHLSATGEIELIPFIASRVSYKVNNATKPLAIIKRNGITVKFGSTSTLASITSVTATTFNSAAPIALVNDFGLATSATLLISSTGNGTLNNSGANTDPTYFTYLGNLYSSIFTKDSIYLNTGDTATFTFAGLKPNTNYEVFAVGSRTAADARITRISGTDGFADINTSPTPANGPVSFIQASDLSGNLTLNMVSQSANFTYISGLQLIEVY